jgi:hypothetical protein
MATVDKVNALKMIFTESSNLYLTRTTRVKVQLRVEFSIFPFL